MIHIIICGYDLPNPQCLASLEMQSCAEFKTYCSADKTGIRKYLPRNTWDTVNLIDAKDDDVLIFLDADDFLCDEDAVKIVSDTYLADKNILLTYGSYVNLSSNKRGKFSGPYEMGEKVRIAPWRATHLKTCSYKLWKKLTESMLKFPDGSWFKCCADRAIMIPLIEMAGIDRIKYIDQLLYCYNDLNQNSVWNTMREESMKIRNYLHGCAGYERIDTF